MTRYLFLASSGKLNDGGLVLNRQLSEALARGHDVHMITIGPCEQQREGVTVVELDEALLSPQAAADVQQTRHFVDRFSKIIRASLDEQGPERVGLPTDPGAFDVIVGYGDVTGPAALHLRDVYYPDAKVSTVITMDPKALFKALNLPELGEHRIGNHREVLARSDLILAHGPKSAVDARQLAAEWPQASSLPPTHEFVPGVETAREDPVPWRPGEPFNVLMLGRMHDENKGAADVVLAMAHMRARGFEDVHLTLRGVDPKNADGLLRLLRENFKEEDEWRSFVTVEEFTDDRAAIERSIQGSHVMVMATESEAYGLAASEYAAHGKPLIVAEGNGNGFATLLQDESRIPRDIADRFVLDDSGSRSANGSLIGESNTATPPPRYTRIAARLTDVHDNYEVYAQAALRLRDHLGEYTHEHAASGIGQAVDNVLAGDIRHTKQIAQGVNIAPSQEELLQGIPSDKHGLILQPREMSPRRPLQEAEVLQGDAETNGPLAAASTGDERQDAALSEARPLSSGGTSASGPDHELAERVRLNELSLERGRREASPFEMLRSGMSQEETMAAISSWEALGRPETAQERQARLEEGRTVPETGAESSLGTPDRTSREAEAPEPTTTAEPATRGPRPAPAPGPGREESRSASDSPEKAIGPTAPTSTAEPAQPRHSTAARTPERTSSAVWETPEPRIESMARHRTQWALYDDLHGYGRRPPLVPVRTPDRGPGAYQDLLHPSTGAAYERDRHQVESGDRGYSR